jgi:multiple sugar transport system permease protein
MVGASGVATPAGVAPDRSFKYWLVVPAIFLLLLVGLWPLFYSLVVSFQNLTMLEMDYSFAGLQNYKALLKDARLWESLLHTVIITAIALPIELVVGLLMA